MTTRPTVSILRTGLANIASVAAAFERLGANVRHIDTLTDAMRADLLVLPGVGSFGPAMSTLTERGLASVLRARLAEQRPLLAICLGLQLLCSRSEESPGVAGLGIVDAQIERLPSSVLVPQMGWNRVVPQGEDDLLVPGWAYYANSYALMTPPNGWNVATSEHGRTFVAAMRRGPILACQFHPELSGDFGLALLRRWLTSAHKEATKC